MASALGTEERVVELLARLHEEPSEFDFFQALRLVECAHPQSSRIGQSRRPSDDPVRLAQEPSVAFAPAAISSFDPAKNGDHGRLGVLFFGLFGPNGPLPLHLTEYARDRQRQFSDRTFSRFADIFHHRLLSLFYRAWACAQPVVGLDRPESDRFAVYIGSLFGLGTPALRNRDAMPDLAKLHFAGRLASPTRNAEGLCALLQDYLGVPAAIHEFVGEWLALPEDCRLRLGGARATGMLGRTTTIGSAIWECRHKFRVVLGPLDLAIYRRLLPGADLHNVLVAIVENYVGRELSWDLRLILNRVDVPESRLGQHRLGWTSWVGERTKPGDADDLLLTPVREPALEVK